MINNEISKQIETISSYVTGVVVGKKHGYGFLAVSKSESYFIPPYQMNKVINGDVIEARIIKSDNGKLVAIPEKVIKTDYNEFVARIKLSDKGCFAEGPGHSSKRAFQISSRKINGYENGDWIKCRISQHPIKTGNAKASIVSKIADSTDPMAPWKVSLAKHNLCDLDLSYSTENKELKNDIESYYADKTHLPFITIDSETTRDMDDAICCEKTSYGYLIHVAISDVSYFIKENSLLDDIALSRGVTSYMPARVIPMIPRELSESACSLVSGEEKRALCCTLAINETGKVINFDFSLAKIKSILKASYEDVSDFIDSGKPWPYCNDSLSQIELLNHSSEKILELRKHRSAVMDYSPDNRFVFDSEMRVSDVTTSKKGSGNRIVEELMIAINICAAKYLTKHSAPALFLANDGVDKSVILDCARQVDPSVAANQDTSSTAGYNLVAKKACENNENIGRMMANASSSYLVTKSKPHLGLGLDCYATITSPIRKYSDLNNHRLIKSIILGSGEARVISDDDLVALNDSINRSKLASNDVNQWAYINLYSAMFGKVIPAVIANIDKVNVYLNPVGNRAEITMLASSIPGFKDIDSTLQKVKMTSGTLSIGDTVNVEITGVNVNALSISAYYRS